MFIERLQGLCSETSTDITNVLKRLGLSTSKGTAWRNGSIPNGKILLQLAEYFDVSTDYLLGESDIKKPAPTNGDELLSPEEIEYLKVFRAANPEKKKAMLLLLGGDK